MSTSPDLSGQMLGQYEIRGRIGAGGMGAVYRAYQANLRREVAVKVLPTALAGETGYLERFNREAAVSASLEHPHIVPVHDYGNQGDLFFVVMRLLTGGSLLERVSAQQQSGRPGPSLPEIGALLKDISSALDYAHSQGIIHRDIKPSNVMFDNQGNAFLVDFGIAKLVGATNALTAAGTTMGTPAYMAPEQWRAEEPVPATDQYAVGVMAYTLVTGRTPFEAPTPYGLMHKHLNELPTPVTSFRQDVPEAVQSVINRAMAKEAAERFESVTAFATAFERAIAGQDSSGTNFFTFMLPEREQATLQVPASGGTGGRVESSQQVSESSGTANTTAPAPDAGLPVWAYGAAALVLIALLIGAALLLTGGDSGGDDSSGQLSQADQDATIEAALQGTADRATLDQVRAFETATAIAIAQATEAPSEAPSEAPTETLSASVTEIATEAPSEAPTEALTEIVTAVPTANVTEAPTRAAPNWPSNNTSATQAPTAVRTEAASEEATEQATEAASDTPTAPAVEVTATFTNDSDCALMVVELSSASGYNSRVEIEANSAQSFYNVPYEETVQYRIVVSDPDKPACASSDEGNFQFYEDEVRFDYAFALPEASPTPVAEDTPPTVEVDYRPGATTLIPMNSRINTVAVNLREDDVCLYPGPDNAFARMCSNSIQNIEEMAAGDNYSTVDSYVIFFRPESNSPRQDARTVLERVSGRDLIYEDAPELIYNLGEDDIAFGVWETRFGFTYLYMGIAFLESSDYLVVEVAIPDFQYQDLRPTVIEILQTIRFADDPITLIGGEGQFDTNQEAELVSSDLPGLDGLIDNVSGNEQSNLYLDPLPGNADFVADLGINEGDIASDTRDVWAFGAAADQEYTLSVQADWDTVLVVYFEGEILAFNDDFSDLPNGLNSLISFTLPTDGEILIAVRGFNADNFGPYVLDISANTGDDTPSPASDGLQAEASTIDFGAGLILSLNLPESSVCITPANNLPYVLVCADSEINAERFLSPRLSDEIDGAAVGFRTIASDANFSANEWLQRLYGEDIEFDEAPPIAFAPEDGRSAFAFGESGATQAAHFALILPESERVLLVDMAFAYEFLDSNRESVFAALATMRFLSSIDPDNLGGFGSTDVGAAVLGENPGQLEAGVRDVWRFNPPAPSNIVFSVLADWDTVLEIWRDGEIISENDDNPELENSLNSRLRYTFTTDAPIQVVVRGFDTEQGGDYVLSIERDDESTSQNTGNTPDRTTIAAETERLNAIAAEALDGYRIVTENEAWEPIIDSFMGVEVVLVPPGCFVMGSTDDDILFARDLITEGYAAPSSDNAFEREQPAHLQCFEVPFWMDRAEIANEQFAVFGGQAESPGHLSAPDQARTRITWTEAAAFCDQRGMRLPFENEWEYAARGPSRLIYPWGNDYDPALAGENPDGVLPIMAVPEGASWVGALNMTGGVAEWVLARPQIYPYDPGAQAGAGGNLFIMRSGAWGSGAVIQRAASRSTLRNGPFDLVGLRCALPLPSLEQAISVPDDLPGLDANEE